eukprot:TRINITY_DN16821_c0_g1_i1.p1 TRINITY_DN16821_c0_g1~~TRINITY_DN16821_c0_g1_i1.p1  ORF type:complete len:194 (+),score=15.07 TRINITY_DN16821_c0_g1_i1:154-735(+)
MHFDPETIVEELVDEDRFEPDTVKHVDQPVLVNSLLGGKRSGLREEVRKAEAFGGSLLDTIKKVAAVGEEASRAAHRLSLILVFAIHCVSGCRYLPFELIDIILSNLVGYIQGWRSVINIDLPYNAVSLVASRFPKPLCCVPCCGCFFQTPAAGIICRYCFHDHGTILLNQKLHQYRSDMLNGKDVKPQRVSC